MRNQYNSYYSQCTINNVQVTNYTINNIAVTPRHGGRHHASGPKTRPAISDRHKPELLRFVQSCGLVDGNKIRQMSDAQVVDGLCEVGHYANQTLAKSVHEFGSAIGGVCRGASWLARGAFKMVASALK